MWAKEVRARATPEYAFLLTPQQSGLSPRRGLRVTLASSQILSDKLRGGVALLNVMITCSHPSIERSKDTVFKNFRLSLKPVLQCLAFFLPTGFVQLLCPRADLALHQLHHHGLLLLSTCFDVHCQSSPRSSVFFYHFNHNGSLLAEYYIRQHAMITKVYSFRMFQPAEGFI